MKTKRVAVYLCMIMYLISNRSINKLDSYLSSHTNRLRLVQSIITHFVLSDTKRTHVNVLIGPGRQLLVYASVVLPEGHTKSVPLYSNPIVKVS